MNISRTLLSTLLALSLFGCTEDTESTPQVSRIEFLRANDGSIQIVAKNLPKTAAIAQFEAVIESDDSFTVTEAQAAQDLPLDSVKARQTGVNRARFFLGDKRGITLRQDGLLASFRLLRTTSGNQNGRIRIESLQVSDQDGNLISIEGGPSILIQ